MRYLILILLIPLALGFEVESQGIVSYDSTNFRITNSYDSVKFDYNNKSLIVDRDECGQLGNYEFCVENVSYDITIDDFTSKVTIEKIYSDIEVSYDVKDIYLGKDTELSVTLTNTGNEETDVKFVMELVGFDLSDCNSCSIVGKSVVYESTLEMDESDTFDFNFAMLVDEKKISAKVITDEITYAPLTFSPKHPFEVTHTFDKSDPVLGEEVELTTKFTNSVDKKVDITKIVMYVPAGILVDGYSEGKANILKGFTLHDETVYVEETVGNETRDVIAQSDFKELNFDIIPKSNDNIELTFDVYYDFNGYSLTMLGEKTDVDSKDFDASVDLSIEKKSYDEMSEHYFFVKLKNPYEFIELRDINIDIVSPLLFENISLNMDSIPKGMSKNVYAKTLNFPKVNETQETYLIVNISFEDEYGRKGNIDKEVEYSIIPLKGVEITASGCTKTLDYGDECKYTIKVKNNNQGDLENVFIRETFNSKIITDGNLYSKIDVDAQKTLTAYSYDISYPKNPRDHVDFANITTLVSYDYLGEKYNYNETRTVFFEKFDRPESDLDLKLTQSFDSKLYKGGFHEVEFFVENSDDETIDNARIVFGHNESFDMIDAPSIFLGELKPYEKKSIKYVFRPKVNDTFYTDAKLIFEHNGYEYEEDYDSKKLSINSGQTSGPMMIITLESPNEPKLGELSAINVIVENRGEDKSRFNITTLSGKREMMLPAKVSRVLIDYALVNSVNTTIGPISFSYDYAGRTYDVISNSLLLQVEEKMQVEVEEKEKINKTQETEEIIEKSIFAKFVDFLLGLW